MLVFAVFETVTKCGHNIQLSTVHLPVSSLGEALLCTWKRGNSITRGGVGALCGDRRTNASDALNPPTG